MPHSAPSSDDTWRWAELLKSHLEGPKEKAGPALRHPGQPAAHFVQMDASVVPPARPRLAEREGANRHRFFREEAACGHPRTEGGEALSAPAA